MRSPRLLPPTVPDDREPTRETAVDLLFRRHYGDLLRLAYCLLGERQPAEDAVQDAFLSLYRHWTRLRDREAAPDYLRSAVFNRCRSRVRELVRERGRLAHQLIDVPYESAEDGALPRAEEARLALAVQDLPRRQREVVVCRYYLELTVAETAALLEITTGSVKRHAHRALETLSSHMEVTR